MSVETKFGPALSLFAGGAVTLRRFVKFSAGAPETCIQCTSGADVALGVALESGAAATVQNPAAMIPVQSGGVAKVTAGAAITAGAQVTSDASGRAITVAAGNVSHGIAMNTVAGANEIVRVLLVTPNVNGPVN